MEEKSNIEKWVESGLDSELLRRLKDENPNDIELQKAELIVNGAENLRPNYQTSKQDLWEQVQGKITEQADAQPTTTKQLRFNGWMAAASVILVVGVLAIWRMVAGSGEDLIAIQTNVAETSKVQLPDKSWVVLNAGSKLEYNIDDWSDKRVVHLNGEAFFDVEKGSKFTVNTALGRVTVLGTSFNVKTREEVLVVSCKTGKVQVNNSLGEEVLVLPGRSVRFQKGSRAVESEINSAHIDSWVSGHFYFTDVPIAEVLSELENQFGVKITVSDSTIYEKRYTGFINSKTELSRVAEDICLPLNLRFEINEGGKEIKIDY